jgi:hypothetical protein
MGVRWAVAKKCRYLYGTLLEVPDSTEKYANFE